MSRNLTAAFGLMALFVLGCADESDTPDGTPPVMSDGHEHDGGHGHPESFKAAVEKMVGMRNTIRDGFAAEDPDAAHGPLHSVGHVLVEVEALAEKESLEAETLTGVRDAVEVLKEKFASVDKMMHGGEGSEYSEVSADIDAAMETLIAASGASEEGHAEGHDDHEDHEDGHDHGEEGHDHGEDDEAHHEEDGHDHDEDEKK